MKKRKYFQMRKQFIIFLGIFLLLNVGAWASVHSESKEHGTDVGAIHESPKESHGEGHGADSKEHGVMSEEHSENAEHLASNIEHQVHGEEAHGEHHEGAVKGFITTGIDKSVYFPILCIIIPFIGAILILITNKIENLRKVIAIVTSGLTFVLVLLMWEPVISGIKLGDELYQGIYYKINYFYNFSLSFKVDPAGYLMILIVSFVWLLTVIYGESYLDKEGRAGRYDFFSLMTMGVNLGVMLAGDFLTLFLFFEGLVLFPYSLIAHREDDVSVRGANYYLYLGVGTGLLLLCGIFLLDYWTGNLEIIRQGDVLAQIPSTYRYIIAFLMILGFGGKAALFGEHIWVPKMYPHTLCTTASLSSGAMIKAGAYGIFRVVNLLYGGIGIAGSSEWFTQINIGYIMIIVGVLTMFLAVLSALISSDSQQMLGYHSVSQMGYIVMGIGCAAYMGKDGAMGLAGALYHIVNHSLFKVSLFLGVGAVYFRTGEQDMYKLGGLWKNMPLSAICLLIAVLGISGVPGFNGFASKTLLHHSIIEAYEHSVHYFGKPDYVLRFAEIIFVLTAAGTFASNIKLFILTFLGKEKEKYKGVEEVPLLMQISLVGFSAAIILIGIFPNWLIEHLIGPALAYFGYDTASHPYHLLYNVHTAGLHSTIPILYEPISHALFSSKDVLHNLSASGTAIFLGGMYFILGLNFNLFHVHLLAPFTVGYYYQKVLDGFKYFCMKPCVFFAGFVSEFISGLMVYIWLPGSREGIFIPRPLPKMRGWEFFSDADTKLNLIMDKTVQQGQVKPWEMFDKMDTKLGRMVDKAVQQDQHAHWEMFDKVDTKFGKMVDKAVQQDQLAHWEMFGKVDSSYDGFLGKVIEKQGGIWRIFGKTDVTYDTILDRLIAGIIGVDVIPVSIIREEEAVEVLPGEGLVKGYNIFCDANGSFDLNIVDGIVNDIAALVRGCGKTLKKIHTGNIPDYILSFIIGAVILTLLFLF